MMNLILTVIVLAVPAYMIFMIVYGYMTATGSTWERVKAAFAWSRTIAWAQLNALSASLIGGVGELSTYFGAPGVRDAIQPYLEPKFMLGYLLFVLIGAEIARRKGLA